MELHVWSPVRAALSLDPDCLACIYLANRRKEEITIVQSSDPSQSPTGQLPCLVLPNKSVISSFFDIAFYFSDNNLSNEDVALISYLQRLRKTAYDQLFLPETYAAVREQITARTPFPLQYTIPLRLKKQASGDAHVHRVEHVLKVVDKMSKARGVAVPEEGDTTVNLATETSVWQVYFASILIVLSLDLPGTQTADLDAKFPHFRRLKEEVRAIRVEKPVQPITVSKGAIKSAIAGIVKTA